MHTQMAFKCETTNLVLFSDHTCDVKSSHKRYHIQPVCTVYTGTAVCVSLCVCELPDKIPQASSASFEQPGESDYDQEISSL